MSRKMTRAFAEALLKSQFWCLIHNRAMEEYGQADLCGTYPTRCPECEKERQK
jgi:hypothetical protein